MKKIKLIAIAILLIITTTGFFSLSFTPVESNDFEISKNIEIFGSVYKEVHAFYVDEPQPGKLMKEGIDGMLKSLDPYTVYIPESDIEDYRFMTTGQYGGIGALIRTREKYVMITDPYEGYPAQKSGLMAGDKILEIDGKILEGKSSDEVSRFLKGQAGTTVKLKVQRDGETAPFEKTLTREEIKIKDVPFYGMINNETGYIKLNGFTQSASSEVKAAFKDLKEKKGMKKLVFDLRGNGGGLLMEAVNIVNIFVPRGSEIVSQKGRMQGMSNVYTGKEEPLDLEMPLVVLIDGGSASASEIVAGAIQDLDRGVIIGQRSYGKGLVQQTKQLPYNSMVKITVAKYYTPSGRCIQKLDYAHKDQSGKAIVFADSLVGKFKTKNGREVFDARGIDPDIKSEEKEFSKIVAAIYSNDLMFDFATKFRKDNASIDPAKTFSLSDKQYDQFLAFIKDKDISYKTASEAKFDELKKTAEKEKYYEGAEKEFESLLNKIKPDKNSDLIKFRVEIKEILENEIVSRYYYQNGRVELSLKNDDIIQTAIETLNNSEKYKGILNGTVKP